ncbi:MULTISPECIES: VanZ family protein [Shouchella]|uniref:VanZ family protein n=2 Tax=Shouchella TaxID=2893057 RepID=A0ABY7W0H3_9BACI|nr:MULTISPECIES: VanZ family protein [Shouchella]MED4129370.1 VanZ family protein [Shouchella miscanthi]WDF02465.1 VanZ family protein [Shouchella hunanensis]
MSRPVKVTIFSLFLLIAVSVIAFSSSTPYGNQDIRGILSHLPIQWIEQTRIAHISFPYGERVISLEYLSVESFVEFFLRKAAHFFSFLFIGLIGTRLLAYFTRLRYASAMSLFFVVFYASIDEYRQSFTPGRSPMIEDVLVDTMGGLVGILIAMFWIVYVRSIKPCEECGNSQTKTHVHKKWEDIRKQA